MNQHLKFQEKLLGRLDYSPPQNIKSNFYLQDFLDQKTITEFVEEMLFDGTCRFTKDGYEFILEAYGLEKIANLIISEHGTDSELGDKENIIKIIKIKSKYI